MKIKNPEKRLQKFAGRVDKKHVDLIAAYVKGHDVLDMGSGFGTTTSYLSKAGFNCTGIDYDEDALQKAKKLFPDCNYLFANAEALPFSDKSFDTIVLRDALHHFYQEADFNKIRSEIMRVSKPHSRIIVFDPNVTLYLKLMRKLAFHKDAECNFETATEIIEKMGYKIIYSGFNTLYSFPLSGAYVGINFTPNIKALQSFILNTELVAEKVVKSLHMGRAVCWKYMIVGEKNTL